MWEMVKRGDIARPQNLLVVNSDNTGMESSDTYPVIDRVQRECAEMGIPFVRVKNANLYEDAFRVKRDGLTRWDNPPFWTRDRITGKRGRLMQKCTPYYKIAPMDAAVRLWMAANLGIPINRKDLGSDAVRKWIGFSNDEWMRIKEPRQEYQYFEYPLIDAKMGDDKIIGYFLKHGIPLPARSVCKACFANDVAYFKDMAENRPQDFEDACKFDDVIRDLQCIGITDECYVSWTLVPLRELARLGFPDIDGEKEAMQCHSGYCFT